MFPRCAVCYGKINGSQTLSPVTDVPMPSEVTGIVVSDIETTEDDTIVTGNDSGDDEDMGGANVNVNVVNVVNVNVLGRMMGGGSGDGSKDNNDNNDSDSDNGMLIPQENQTSIHLLFQSFLSSN